VHRDVSPHNVLVGLDGIARITDFGIARAEERLSTTRNGQVKGKLSYMSPEQTTSETVTRRADLFTTGVVLWETLAGKRLFNGQSDGEVYRKLVESPIPRLSSVLADVPPALDEVVARALARSPFDRYESGAEFADALEQAAAPIGIASQRTVAQFVQQLVGEQLEAMRTRVREVRASNPGPDTSGSISAVRSVSGRGSIAPVVPSLPPPLPPGAVQSVPPAALQSVAPPVVAAESSPKRLWLVAVIVGLVAALASAVGVVLASKHTPRDPAPTVAPAAIAPPAPAAPLVQPAPVAQPEAASPVIDAAVPAQPAADLTFEPGSAPSERTPRPRSTGARTNGSSGANPNPSTATPPANGSRQYNPEWM
jgi:serine/threonine-protein kinase